MFFFPKTNLRNISKLFIIKNRITSSDILKKAISPLMATVLLLAITLAVGGILGSWFVSMSRSSIEEEEGKLIELINCTGSLDIVKVTCNGTNTEFKVIIHNIATDINLYDFSTFALVNNVPYTNSTGGPNSTSPLGAGEQTILEYSGCTACVVNATINKVRVSPGNCPKGWIEIDAGEKCSA